MPHPVVVVVDDNTDYLTFMTTLLAFSGYAVLTCRRSADAFALVRARQPDCVLLDIRMEQLQSGFDVLRSLRAEETTAEIPVLLCSADVEALHAFAAANHEQHTSTLAKPFDLPKLLAALARITRSNSLKEEGQR